MGYTHPNLALYNKITHKKSFRGDKWLARERAEEVLLNDLSVLIKGEILISVIPEKESRESRPQMKSGTVSFQWASCRQAVNSEMNGM